MIFTVTLRDQPAGEPDTAQVEADSVSMADNGDLSFLVSGVAVRTFAAERWDDYRQAPEEDWDE